MSNFELPNDKQLEQLRKKGLAPYSSFLTSSLIAVAVLLCVIFCFDYFLVLFQGVNSFTDLAKKKDLIFRLLLLPPISVLVSSLLFILFQRKFYVNFSLLSPFLRKQMKFDLYYRFIFSFIKNTFLLAFIACLIGIVFYYLFPLYFEVLTKSIEDDLEIFLLALKSFLSIIIAVIGCSFLVWFVVYKLLFLFFVVVNKNKV